MINRYRKLSLSFITACLLASSSCNDFLELEPISSVSDEAFWKTNADASAGVAAIYDAMQGALANKFLLWGDFRTDNFVSTPQSSTVVQDLIANNIQTNNSDALRWNEYYNMIGRANLAIENIPKIPLFNRTLLAEAYAARAFAYFDLARAFGAVPLILKPIVNPASEPLPSKTDGITIINNLVLEDLRLALEYGLPNKSVNRFSAAGVYCLRANIYCYLKQWDNALTALNDLQAISPGNTFRLASTRDQWRELFLNDVNPELGRFERGDELIFQLKWSFSEDGRNAARVWFLLNPPTPQLYYSKLLEDKWTARFPLTKPLWDSKYGVNSIPPTVLPPVPPATVGTNVYGDYRFLEGRTAGAANGVARVLKYSKTPQNSRDDDTDLPIYRFSDMVLLRALVLNKISFANKNAAIDQINIIRRARQLPNVTAAEVAALDTQDKLEDYILDERQFELVAEGKRWWDLVYTDKAVQVMNPINGLTANGIFLPIFFQHVVDNPNLK